MTTGKKFERVINDAFSKYAYVLRLMDPPIGYLGAANVCDFIVYYKSQMIMMELKVVGKGKSFPKQRLPSTQLDGMLHATRYGILAGVLVWYKGFEKTVWYSIGNVKSTFEHRKSLPMLDYDIELCGTRKRVWFDYDAKSFLELICAEKCTLGTV